ncbi:RibD family protein [Larsenimonas salina]|uniref:RibD family protein n=1 Tax=Larsenimonas salina TaxID=1295565 RepID=UPI0020745D1E|nr:RibD family protein [Larsenimonas salina]MCM5703809.1 RibD family protein [Larsenimonas salina]
MTKITVKGDFWSAIKALKHHAWTGQLELECLSGRIEIAPDGTWHALTPIDDVSTYLCDVYVPLVSFRYPMTLGQLGQSLDGRIATVTGASRYVTGHESLIHLHRVRALVDAVLVGAGTVEADDPRLTVRHVEGDQPTRVVLDPNARVSAQSSLFHDEAAPTLYLSCVERDRPLPSHVDCLLLDATAQGSGISTQAILEALHARGLKRVLIEGGGLTVSRFVAERTLDRLHVTVAPMLIGSGRPAMTLPEIISLDDALRPYSRTFALGKDVLFDLAFDDVR